MSPRHAPPESPPRIGITADRADDKYESAVYYTRAVVDAGGTPIILPHRADRIDQYLDLCDGVLLSGGDDPRMEPWGEPTHPKAKPIHEERQAFETALLEALAARPAVPALGVCLGMQLMGLHAGGRLDQHLADSLKTADQHWGRVPHAVTGEIGRGTVISHHRQALIDPGSLRVIGTAPDGVIEAIDDPERAFYLGVQWHPERTVDDASLGSRIIERLVVAARERASSAR